jgi:hypothetical protein
MFPVLFALTVAACAPGTGATQTTVTETSTTTEKVAEKTNEKAEGAAEAPSDDAQPCTSLHVEAAVAPGEWPTPQTWQSAVVLTNLGPDVCSLDGASELRFFTGGNGARLEVNQVMTDGEAGGPVVLAVEEQASMALLVPTAAEPTPDCEEGATFVDVVLTGDDDVASAEGDIPAICGAVQVSPWSSGGAPGVVPN